VTFRFTHIDPARPDDFPPELRVLAEAVCEAIDLLRTSSPKAASLRFVDVTAIENCIDTVEGLIADELRIAFGDDALREVKELGRFADVFNSFLSIQREQRCEPLNITTADGTKFSEPRIYGALVLRQCERAACALLAGDAQAVAGLVSDVYVLLRQEVTRTEKRRRAPRVTHAPHHHARRLVYAWYRQNQDKFPSMKKAAEEAVNSRLVDQDVDTVYGWIRELKRNPAQYDSD
jgi:hypothetical protein